MRDSSERADENLTILEGMAEADVRAGRASIMFAHPEVLASNKNSENYCFLNFIRKMLSVWWLTRLTVTLIGKFIISQIRDIINCNHNFENHGEGGEERILTPLPTMNVGFSPKYLSF